MVNKLHSSDYILQLIVVVLGAVLIIAMAYPIYFVLIASFSSPSSILSGRAWIIPADVSLEGYQRLFGNTRIWIGYRNTIAYTLVGTAFSLACTLTAAYSLSRKSLPFRKGINLFLVFTMFFSGGLVPTYFVIRDSGLINTFWVMVIPFAVSVYNVIIARTFFSNTIPEELFDAGRIDGCDYFRFFWQILIPLSKVIIAVLSLYYAVWYWNEYFRALMYIKDDRLVPLQIVLRDILIINQSAANLAGTDMIERIKLAEMLKYCIIVVSTLPLMLVYPFIQKYFTKGVMLGSLKG
jgi:putative aldouronate transport system permease protein